MRLLKIENQNGVRFNIKVVRPGERYGLKKCLTHGDDDPMVEFYDARQDPAKFDSEGQFVSRYNLSTLRGEDGYGQDFRITKSGLCLHGGVPDWSVDSTAMQKVMEWLDSECPQPDK